MKTAFTLSLIVFAFLFCAGVVVAQTQGVPIPVRPQGVPKDPGARDPNDPPLTEIEEEMRAKHAIKVAEKEHEENLDRAREIAQIGKQLQQCARMKKSNFPNNQPTLSLLSRNSPTRVRFYPGTFKTLPVKSSQHQ
jgi:hypothetical protein